MRETILNQTGRTINDRKIFLNKFYKDAVNKIPTKWKPKEIINAYFDATKKGLLTEIHGKKIIDWGKIFLSLSKLGLNSRNKINKKGNNEAIYLKNIENILAEEKTKAEKSIKIA